jgi:hypothetical protein
MYMHTGGPGGGHDKKGTAERRAELRERRDTPVMHIEARHAQVGNHGQPVVHCIAVSARWSCCRLSNIHEVLSPLLGTASLFAVLLTL